MTTDAVSALLAKPSFLLEHRVLHAQLLSSCMASAFCHRGFALHLLRGELMSVRQRLSGGTMQTGCHACHFATLIHEHER